MSQSEFHKVQAAKQAHWTKHNVNLSTENIIINIYNPRSSCVKLLLLLATDVSIDLLFSEAAENAISDPLKIAAFNDKVF